MQRLKVKKSSRFRWVCQTLYYCIVLWLLTVVSGYEKEFSTLGPVLESAAQRQDRRLREFSNMEASILLQQCKAQGQKRATDAASQVVVPCATRPLRGPDSPEGCRRKGKGPLGGSVGSRAGSHTYSHGKNAWGQAR